MKTYSEKLKDPRWQRKRLEVMQRDGFKCRDCGSDTEHLHVHHCFYERGGPWETSSELLLTLCEKCHDNRECCEEIIKREVARRLVSASATRVELIAEDLAKEPGSAFVASMNYVKEETAHAWILGVRGIWPPHSNLSNAVEYQKAPDSVLEELRSWSHI